MVGLEKLFEEKGIKTCPICGMPFEPYHSRQRTCGSDECRRTWKNAYTRERSRAFRENDREGWRRYHREAQRKYRHKKKAAEEREAQLEDIHNEWVRKQNFDLFVTEHGHEYGKLSAEKVLAQVPKINVNLEDKNAKE